MASVPTLGASPVADSQFNVTESDIIHWTQITASTISLCGSLFIMSTYFRFPNLRSFAFKLILWMSVADAIHCISNLLPTDDYYSDALCKIQAITMTFSELASVLWVGSIAYTIQFVFLRDKDSPPFGECYHAVIWGLSLCACTIPIITDNYGLTGMWCWITRSDAKGQVLRWLLYYVPAWFVFIYITWIYTRTWKMLDTRESSLLDYQRMRRMHSEMKDTPSSHQLVTKSRVKWYPVVLAVTILFSTSDRFYQAIFEGKRNFTLEFLHTLTNNLQGFINFLIYGMTESVRREWGFGSMVNNKVQVVDDVPGVYD